MSDVKALALDVATIAKAVEEVRGLDITMWADNGEHFSCTEACALADLLGALGLENAADYLMTGHYYGDGAERDEEVENHIHNGVRDSRIRPGLMWAAGTEPY